MQRWSVVGSSLLFLGAILIVMLRAPGPRAGTAAVEIPPSGSASTGSAELPGPPGLDAGTVKRDGGPAEDDFSTFPDGGPVPPLPPDAPSHVSFGVILFAYKGAQFAAADAPLRAQALDRAKATLQDARKAFAEAVKRGDPGSTAEAGHIPRGILEPAVEYVLFTLAEGAVCDEPVDTPRGYWIVRRNK